MAAETSLAAGDQRQVVQAKSSSSSSSSSSTPIPSEPTTESPVRAEPVSTTPTPSDYVGASAAKATAAAAAGVGTSVIETTTPSMNKAANESTPQTVGAPARAPSMLKPLLQEDCPICLEEMTPVDHEHPLQCKSVHCEFNCCYHCIENLIISSKDDFMESSDGNFHVKVYLHCPNCRGDLSDSIRDTLLLRKTDAVIMATEFHPQDLTDKQLKWQYAMTTNVDVMNAIQGARKLEKAFFGTNHRKIGPSCSIASTASASFSDTDTDTDDEHDIKDVAISGSVAPKADSSPKDVLDLWGVEVDLINDVHDSFYIPASHIPSPVHRFNLVEEDRGRTQRGAHNQVDSTLMRGLEYFLEKEDQVEICNMLTSGDVDQLVDAAKWLYEAGESANHTQQQQRTRGGGGGSSGNKKRSRPRLSKRSSVYMLIEESRQAHETAYAKRSGTTQVLKSIRQHQRTQRRQQRRRMSVYDAKKRASFLKHYPLPVRMPKHVEHMPLDPFPINLIEGTWDGTVMDAFNRVRIRNGKGCLMHGIGIRNLLSSCGNGPDNSICGGGDGDDPAGTDPLSSFTRWLDMLCQGDSISESAADGMTASQLQRQQQQEEDSMITQIPTTHKGVINNILGGIEVRIAMPGEHKRVYVQSITNQAGRLGIVKGDVISHLNGEPITCRETMEMKLLDYKSKGHVTIPITFNAESSVAEALRRRSDAILNEQY